MVWRQVIAVASPDDPHVIIVACFMTAAMGFHNVAAKDAIATCPATTVMTSTMVTVATLAAQAMGYRCCPGPLLGPTDASAKGDDASSKFKTAVWPLCMFVLGALIGALLAGISSFWCLCVPLVMVSVFVFDAGRLALQPKADAVIADIAKPAAGLALVSATAAVSTTPQSEPARVSVAQLRDRSMPTSPPAIATLQVGDELHLNMCSDGYISPRSGASRSLQLNVMDTYGVPSIQ